MNQRFIESPLGWLRLAETGGKLIALQFLDEKPVDAGNDESELLSQSVEQLQQYFAGKVSGFDLLSSAGQPGTGFQQRVWNELCKIPYGATISYRELAIRLGDEKCIRAAASANGQNNIAIAVPCHRVIGSDGSLTGYAGGIWRKKWLLEHEAKHSGRSTQANLF